MADKCFLCRDKATAITKSKFVCDACYLRIENGLITFSESILINGNECAPHMMTASIENVLSEIHTEIERAQSIHPQPSFAALIEEIGEVATDIQNGDDPRAELIQVAAVAVRLIIERWTK